MCVGLAKVMLVPAVLLENTNLWLIVLRTKVLSLLDHQSIHIFPRWAPCWHEYFISVSNFDTWENEILLTISSFQKLVTSEEFLSTVHNIRTVSASELKLHTPVKSISGNVSYNDLCFPKTSNFGSMRKEGKCDITKRLKASWQETFRNWKLVKV